MCVVGDRLVETYIHNICVFLSIAVYYYLSGVVILGVDVEERKLVAQGVAARQVVILGHIAHHHTVAVVGGGNAAVEEGMYLTKFASKVYLIHRRNELRADKIIQERAFKNPKIEFVWDTVVREIKGDSLVNSLVVENVKTGASDLLNVSGIFPYIGIVPNAEQFSGQLAQDAKGFIVTDEKMQTSVEGVFAVGDVRTTPLRQVITAAADGAVAAVYAVKFVETLKDIPQKV